MDHEQLYDKRVKMVRNLMEGKENEYVPTVSLVQTWAMAYAQTDCYDTFSSQEREFEVYSKYLKDLDYDTTLLFAMNRPLDLYMSLGYSPFFFSDDGVTLQNKDHCAIPLEELDEYIEDPIKYLRNKVIYRRYPAFREHPMLSVIKCIPKLLQFKGKNDAIPDYLRKNVGVPVLVNSDDLMEAALDRYVGWRSFSEGMIDLRRRPEKVDAALEATYEQVTKPAPGERKDFPMAFAPVVSATYLGQKAYERFFWPWFKKMCDEIITSGGHVMVALEGTWGKAKYDHFNDFPKGTIMAFLEGDDIVEAKSIIGDNCVLCGGLNDTLVRSGTPEENVEAVKRVIDACGRTGYMISSSKCLLSPNDAKAENLKAVNDFIHEYTAV